MALFRHRIINHRNLYLLGMTLLLVSLPLSPFGISLGTFILGGNWLLEGAFKEKWTRLRQQPYILLFASLFLIWIAGLWNTENFSYAWHDLKIKVPILVLPLLIGSSKHPDAREFRLLALLYLGALWAAAITGYLSKAGFVPEPPRDTSHMGFFVSHIRLSLMMGTGLFLDTFLFPKERNPVIRLFLILTLPFLGIFLVLQQTFTALFVLAVWSLTEALLFISSRQNKMLQYFLSIFMVMLGMLFLAWVSAANNRFYTILDADLEHLDSLTANGNRYLHLTNEQEWENGHYTWIYYCEPELKKEWNRISNLKYDGKDNKGNDLRFTLIRYMTSKGLRKDSAGLAKLEPADIRAIESGIANVLYTRPFSIYRYYYRWLWELNHFRRTGDPSGHSLIQRYVYQKTGWSIAKSQLFTGVGTGDVQDAFTRAYETSNVKLERRWWLRAHNQYLTTLITAGLLGLLWFLYAFFYPWLRSGRRDKLTIGFLILASVSMLWEDSFETQAGIFFVVFFYVFIIFVRPEKMIYAGNEKDG